MTSPSDDYLFAWVRVLDELTYYELFAVAPDATPDVVRAAFHVFCDAFHPDRHAGRPEDERQAVSTVFKRGTEAYLVLSDEGLRSHYDAQLSSRTTRNPPRDVAHSRPPSAASVGPPKLEDAVKSSAARPFARRAEELMRAGDYRQAKLQLVMANHMDPDNDALQAALKDVEARLKPTA